LNPDLFITELLFRMTGDYRNNASSEFYPLNSANPGIYIVLFVISGQARCVAPRFKNGNGGMLSKNTLFFPEVKRVRATVPQFHSGGFPPSAITAGFCSLSPGFN